MSVWAPGMAPCVVVAFRHHVDQNQRIAVETHGSHSVFQQLATRPPRSIGSDITSRPSRYNNNIISKTQQQYCTTTSMVRQHRYPHRLRGLPPIKLRGLRSTTPTDNPTRVHFYPHRRPRLEASVSSPQCYMTLRRTS
jgi:hypothetical protein